MFAVGESCSVSSRHIRHSRGLNSELKRFLFNESGSATIEFVIWMPMFSFLLALIADASMVFMANARMWDVARDTARRMALRTLTAEEARELALANLYYMGQSAEVETTDGSDVIVQIAVPIEDATVFGPFSSLLPGSLQARVVMLREPV